MFSSVGFLPYILQKNYMSFIQWIDKIDKELFILINSKYTFHFLDAFMLLFRKAELWVPLYAVLLVWIIRKHSKFAITFIIFSVISFAITDFVSASILKPFFERPRPCYDENLQRIMRNIMACGGRFGFPSSHASNHFGLACFWFTTVRFFDNKKWYWLWIWAAIICYAQIYVEKHYPFEIAAGALFGTITGYIVHLFFRQWHFGNNIFVFRKNNQSKKQSKDASSYFGA